LIGKALSEDLVKDGHEVIVLSRNPQKVREWSTRVRTVAWDGRTAQGWGELVNGAQAIVNLAGENLSGQRFFPARWTPEQKQRIHQSRLEAGQAVVDAVQGAAHKPSVLVQASAVGYYGPRSEPQVIEAVPAGEDFLAQLCVKWEASTVPVEAMGIRRAVIRTGIVLSREAGALSRQVLPFRFFAGGPIGSGRQGYPWIHITDVIGAIRFLIDKVDAGGVYNLCAPQPLTNAEFGRTLGRCLHRPYWLPLPAFAFRLAFGEVSTLLLDGQMAYPQRLLELGYPFHFPYAEQALKDLLT
jgi:uncharacterized protein (TIGR01777 family)